MFTEVSSGFVAYWLGNGFATFKPRAGVKKPTVATAVQVGTTFVTTVKTTDSS
jgi:hypothetical protein